ncbi:basic salivary proline-rich protein 2-like [Penaeus indicus]|uniref:basic salivary proline-rich protein 2-like n=1 Tax=Penaeus indicus TaxID=29960 RepID=UPI00300CD091
MGRGGRGPPGAPWGQPQHCHILQSVTRGLGNLLQHRPRRRGWRCPPVLAWGPPPPLGRPPPPRLSSRALLPLTFRGPTAGRWPLAPPPRGARPSRERRLRPRRHACARGTAPTATSTPAEIATAFGIAKDSMHLSEDFLFVRGTKKPPALRAPAPPQRRPSGACRSRRRREARVRRQTPQAQRAPKL